MKFYKKYRPLLELNNSKFYIIALTGGRGSLKTGHGIRGVLKACMEEKKRACFFRETKETIKESVKAEIDAIIEEDFKDRGFISKLENINHINGSYIFFKGLKEINDSALENLKGIASNTDYFIVDEAQAVSKKVWDVLIPTLRKVGSVLVVIYNRIKDKLPVEEALFLDYENMKAPEGTYFVEVNYPEIEHLGLLSIMFLKNAELLKKNKPEEYAIKYLNKVPSKAKLSVVKYFSGENINENITYCDDEPIYWSLDFNVDPAMSILSHRDIGSKKFFVFDEIVIENCTTQDVANEFVARYKGHSNKVVINGDASGDYRKTQSSYSDYAIILKTLRKNGFEVEVNIRPFNPPIQHRINSFNDVIYGDDGIRKWFCHPKCKWLIYNMRNLRYKEGTSLLDLPSHNQIKNDEEVKFLGHIFDATSYQVEYYYPIKKKIE